MKLSTKAALLSGLIFPGIGHFVLKQYFRASVLAFSALAAFSVVVKSAFQRALTIVDRINSGDIPVDTGAISEMVSNSARGADSFLANTALIVLGICWLIGIFDSYRLGVAQEKRSMRTTTPGER
jgi:hypothetical protein